jgi:diguanylate cyclase (GGDEF)-like protein/PAS domain S-box-containing protein
METDKTEHNRLQELHSYCILDTSSESEFDNITKLISKICETPIATITLIDEKREWFKSVVGLKERQNDRNDAFCARAIQSDNILIISDASCDPDFSTNPMVIGDPHIRFYAGVPLISPNGHALGALAVKDYKPRKLTPLQLDSLNTMAEQVMVLLELRRNNTILKDLSKQRDQINHQLTLQSTHSEKEREFLKALLESLSEGIVACDDKEKLSLFNHLTRNIHGLSDEKLSPDLWAEYYDLYAADGQTLLPVDQIPLFRAFRGETIVEEELIIVPKNQSQKVVICNGQPIFGQGGKKLGAVVAMRDVTEQKAKEAALIKSEAKLSTIFNQSHLFQCLMEVNGTVLEINDIALKSSGYMRNEEIGKKFWDTSWWTHDQQISDYVKELVVKTKSGEVVNGSTDYCISTGERRQAEFILTPIRDKVGKILYLLASVQDVTERKKSEIELARMNRALRLLSSSNELLIRTKNEPELLSQLCELIVKVGGYEMSWVGYSFNDPDKSIKPIAFYGDFSHLENIKLSWSEHLEIGKGPAAKTIRTGKSIVIQDIMQDVSFKPWATSAIKNGYRGVICLPLINNHEVFGLIAMYTKHTVDAAASELKLLQELADDLAFGIMNIRAQDESKRFHASLYKMAASVSANIDEEFLIQLTSSMIEATGADGGFIAQIENTVPLKVKMLAALVDGKKIENIESDAISGSCQHLLVSESFILSQSISEFINPSQTMISLGMKDYIGQRLINSKGEVIGMLFIMMREPIKHAEVPISILRVFAARAGAELDRLKSDQHIRNQASLLDKAQDAIIVRDLDNKIQFWNNGAERLYGWTRQEVEGSLIGELLYPDPSKYYIAMEKLLQEGEWNGEIEHQTKFAEKLIIESHWTLVYDEQGKPQSVFAINTNITDRKAAADKIQHLAFYDPLTELPNRTLLLDRLKQALNLCNRSKHYGALLFIDVDNFKGLNDTLGHDVGDLLLKEIGERLKKCVRETDSVARFGGDEFVVMLEDVSDSEFEAALLTSKVTTDVLASLNEPYNLGNYEYQSSASIGVTLFSDQESSISELLKRADLAMYKAKALGGNTTSFFDPAMQSEISSRVSIESDLRLSITKNQFSLDYQPQLNEKDQIIGAEALLRWRHPERGMVPPGVFIPIAEESRMILPIGQWVLESACAKLVSWSKRVETADLSLAVNVSELQFRQPDFVEKVLNVLDQYGANPNRLKLELTESLFAENVEDVIIKMRHLKEKGISFSLDDFGTGYSSLSYLKQMPLDQLKIDQSFVRDVMHDPNDASIARTIISLAQSLDLEVIAEGVETEDQLKFLQQNGCHLYQGYLFSKPLPENLFDELLQTQSRKSKFNEE